MANLRLICKLAMDTLPDELTFMTKRVGEEDERWQGTPAGLIVQREKIYADFTLLRSAQVRLLKGQDWKDFLDRRWEQYAECGFNFKPPNMQSWTDFWKKARTTPAKAALEKQTALPAYTRKAVQTTKQKLRALAKQAEDGDKVLDRVVCHNVANCVFIQKKLRRNVVYFLATGKEGTD